MVKRKNHRKLKTKLSGISGWLIPILILLIYSAISNSYLLIQRIIAIFNRTAGAGVYISAGLLIVYCASLMLTIFLIFIKKKIAIKTLIVAAISGTLFSFWYFLIGQLIYYPEIVFMTWRNNIPTIILNIALTISGVAYFLKSKRVKNTLRG